MPRHRDEHGPQLPGAASRALTVRRRGQARAKGHRAQSGADMGRVSGG
jgi:hypothetical protein